METSTQTALAGNLRPHEVVEDELRLVGQMQDIELTDRERADFAQIEAITAMHDLVIDDSSMSAAASLLVQIMSEFAADKEPFQPSVDSGLRQFLEEKVQEYCPDLSTEEWQELFGTLRDFPPLEKAVAEASS